MDGGIGFGDPTARLLGRVSLNPLVHIDPIGTVLFPLLGAFSPVPLIGWAKPVPVNIARLRRHRRDYVLVAAAGPASNLILAVLASSLLHLVPTTGGGCRGGRAAGTLREHRHAYDRDQRVAGLVQHGSCSPAGWGQRARRSGARSAGRRDRRASTVRIPDHLCADAHRDALVPDWAVVLCPDVMAAVHVSTRAHVVSGMRPTGKLHLGHLVGALGNWVGLQDKYNCFCFIVYFPATLSSESVDPRSSRVTASTTSGTGLQKAFERRHRPTRVIDPHLLPKALEPALTTLFDNAHSWLERVPT